MIQLSKGRIGQRVIVSAQWSPHRGMRAKIVEIGSATFVVEASKARGRLHFFPSELEPDTQAAPIPIDSPEFCNSPEAKKNEKSWEMKRKRK